MQDPVGSLCPEIWTNDVRASACPGCPTPAWPFRSTTPCSARRPRLASRGQHRRTLAASINAWQPSSPPRRRCSPPLGGAVALCAAAACGYEVHHKPLSTARYCHCTRCQRRTGTASVGQPGLVPRAGFRVVSGAVGDPLSYTPPAPGVPKLFCASCGSALFSGDPFTRRADRGIRLGTFDADPGLRPQYRQFVAYARPLGGDS